MLASLTCDEDGFPCHREQSPLGGPSQDKAAGSTGEANTEEQRQVRIAQPLQQDQQDQVQEQGRSQQQVSMGESH